MSKRKRSVVINRDVEKNKKRVLYDINLTNKLRRRWNFLKRNMVFFGNFGNGISKIWKWKKLDEISRYFAEIWAFLQNFRN